MKLAKKFEDEVALFVKVCKRLADNMFTTSHGGNLAWKLENDLILITPTKVNKGDITPGDLVFIDRAGNTVEGKRSPTGEKPMYLKFFEDRPDVVSVLHCHPPCVCAFAIMKGENLLMRPFFPETVSEIGPVPVVPYGEPLTVELANNFAPFLKKYNSFIMENHGLVTMSRGDIYWTLLNVELLEATADSILRAKSSGGKLKEMTREAVRNIGNVMRTRNLPLFGVPGANKSLEDLYFQVSHPAVK